MDKIKAIIFDFDNTIVDYIKLDIESLNKVLNLLPYKLNNEQFIDISVENLLDFYKKLDDGLECAENIYKYRLERTLKYFNILWDDKYLNCYLKHFLTASYCFDGIEEVLKNIHGKVKTAILTNSYNLQHQKERIINTGLRKYFDDVIVCCEIGMYKPEKEAFHYLIHKYNIDPSESIYVGDSEEYDIKGAKNAGMHAIRIIHNKYRNVNSESDFVCHSFMELKKILGEHYYIT